MWYLPIKVTYNSGIAQERKKNSIGGTNNESPARKQSVWKSVSLLEIVAHIDIYVGFICKAFVFMSHL